MKYLQAIINRIKRKGIKNVEHSTASNFLSANCEFHGQDNATIGREWNWGKDLDDGASPGFADCTYFADRRKVSRCNKKQFKNG